MGLEVGAGEWGYRSSTVSSVVADSELGAGQMGDELSGEPVVGLKECMR